MVAALCKINCTCLWICICCNACKIILNKDMWSLLRFFLYFVILLYLEKNCEPLMWDNRTNVTTSLDRGTKVKEDFKRATLRRAPEVIQRHTCTFVGGHGARDKLGCSWRPSQKWINVWMLFGLFENSSLDACLCLDMWIYN